VPDFVALVLVFWCVRQPRLVGLGVAWALGLITDAGNGVLLGQHALAYSILAFLGIWLSRRILWFGPGLQALHVGAMLLAAQAVALLVRIIAGDGFPGWAMLVGPAAGAILWPMVSWLLLIPQRVRLNCATRSGSSSSSSCASASPASPCWWRSAS
jgi:rod shape-determining protein MreD